MRVALIGFLVVLILVVVGVVVIATSGVNEPVVDGTCGPGASCATQ